MIDVASFTLKTLETPDEITSIFQTLYITNPKFWEHLVLVILVIEYNPQSKKIVLVSQYESKLIMVS